MRWHTVSRLSDHQELTPEGFLLVRDVPIARTGMQLYRDSELPDLAANQDGWIAVDREPSEVFNETSIASFQGKPLTDDHPMDVVTPDNWTNLAIGHVQNARRGTGETHDLLIADLLFTTSHGIRQVRSGKRSLSVGYDAQYEQDAPGRARQRRIVANHVALVDEGRCGTRCVILDGVPSYGIDAAWEESKHPRDDEGQFSETEGGGGKATHTSTFTKGYPPTEDELNGVKFNSYVAPKSNKAWEAQAKAAKFDEPPLPKTSKKQGAGVIIKEPDGRVWIVHPTNEYGGYKATFPKGTVEPDMTTRGTALKETWEESGLHVRLTGFAGDVERDTSTARYYFAERIGGTPNEAGWETEKVSLVPVADLKQHLNKQVDHKMVDDFLKEAEAAKPQPQPQLKSAPKNAGGPIDTGKWKKVGGQLGSNPGGQYEDESGTKHYVKVQKSESHAKNEHLAARLYEAAGAPVLNTKLINHGGKLSTATEWKSKEDIDPNDPDHQKQAQAHFATHAWLANWDAAGLSYDNQGIVDGKMTTLDPGGSLLYRAQGGLKGDAFGNSVNEWDTLRQPSNKQAHKIFGSMKPADLRRSALNVASVPDSKIDELVIAHGPGDFATRIALAEKLKARKRDVVKRVIGAGTKDAWANDVDFVEGDHPRDDEGKFTLADIENKWTEMGLSHHVHEHGGVITLSKIVVPKEQRGSGVGSRAMRMLTEHADREKKTIALSPSTHFGASSKSRLESFYRGHGFVPNKGRKRDFSISESMVRLPVSDGWHADIDYRDAA